MSLLLKAFPHGRPIPRAFVRSALVLAPVLAMVTVLLPLADSAEARRPPGNHRNADAAHGKGHSKARPGATRKARAHAKAKRVQLKRAQLKRAKAKRAKSKRPTRVVCQPSRNYVMPATSFFSYPNRSGAERHAIRKRVLRTINSVWGGPRSSIGTPLPGNGSIRIATWSFDSWETARALVAARKRGVSVQVVAAKSANKDHAAWRWLRKRLGSRLYRPGHPSTASVSSFARQCRGSCRGPGGTPHAKYFLFDNVGASHKRHVVVQTSMNLTGRAAWGQWNQAQVMHEPRVYRDFLAVFNQARVGRQVAQPYHVAVIGSQVVHYFFPRPQATVTEDPIMQNLNAVSCTGATAGSPGGRTQIRVIQYAIYSDRGVWIAKKLRSLWNAGCNLAIIYSVASRPVLRILRSRSGRGPVPMRQSVVKDPWGNIVKYNHSKWMSIVGRFGSSTGAHVTLSGSANWARLAFGDDEQMQRLSNRTETRRHVAAFGKTWRQKSSRPPPGSGRAAGARTLGRTSADASADTLESIPEEPVFGRGIYRYLTED